MRLRSGDIEVIASVSLDQRTWAMGSLRGRNYKLPNNLSHHPLSALPVFATIPFLVVSSEGTEATRSPCRLSHRGP